MLTCFSPNTEDQRSCFTSALDIRGTCVNTISCSERSPIPLANLNLLSFHKVLVLGVCIKGQKPTQLCMIIMTVLLPVSIIMAAVAEET